MSWRCIVLVPQELKIEFATDISTAMAGAQNLMRNIRSIQSGDQLYVPKLLELVGPDAEIKAWVETLPKPDDDDPPKGTTPSDDIPPIVA